MRKVFWKNFVFHHQASDLLILSVWLTYAFFFPILRVFLNLTLCIPFPFSLAFAFEVVAPPLCTWLWKKMFFRRTLSFSYFYGISKKFFSFTWPHIISILFRNIYIRLYEICFYSLLIKHLQKWRKMEGTPQDHQSSVSHGSVKGQSPSFQRARIGSSQWHGKVRWQTIGEPSRSFKNQLF